MCLEEVAWNDTLTYLCPFPVSPFPFFPFPVFPFLVFPFPLSPFLPFLFSLFYNVHQCIGEY